MTTTCLNDRTLHLRRLQTTDQDALYKYLMGLSDETRKRFGPHPFDKETIAAIISHPETYSGFVADVDGGIVAYSIIKKGFLEHDRPRLESYGLTLDPLADATFAPSVADGWQGLGLGSELFHYMIPILQSEGIKRIILWGGVQCSNHLAVSYYRKLGFSILGQFEYYGQNYDMSKDISR